MPTPTAQTAVIQHITGLAMALFGKPTLDKVRGLWRTEQLVWRIHDGFEPGVGLYHRLVEHGVYQADGNYDDTVTQLVRAAQGWPDGSGALSPLTAAERKLIDSPKTPWQEKNPTTGRA